MSGTTDNRVASPSRRGPLSSRAETYASPSTLRVAAVATAASSSTSAPPTGSVLRTVAGAVVGHAVSESSTAIMVIANVDRIVDHPVPVRHGEGDGHDDRRRAESGDDDRTVAALVGVRDSVGDRFAARRTSCLARDAVSAGTSITTADSSDERTCRCGARKLRHFRPRFRGSCRPIARFNGASMPHEGIFSKSSFAIGAQNLLYMLSNASYSDNFPVPEPIDLPLEKSPAQSPLGLNPLFPLGNRSVYGFLFQVSSPTAPRRFLSHTPRTYGARMPSVRISCLRLSHPDSKRPGVVGQE